MGCVRNGSNLNMIPDFIKIEYICFTELFLLVKRDVRYLYLVVSMYSRSLFAWNEARLLRAAYCLARHVDDVLDGDRNVRQDPVIYVRNIIHQIEIETFDPLDPISRLTAFIFTELENRYDTLNTVKNLLLELFSTMMTDYSRVHDRLLYPEKQLDDLLYKILACALDITLIISRADTRSTDISDLIYAQVCLYTVRDLQPDLAKNIINIPENVMRAATGDAVTLVDYQKLTQSQPVLEWRQKKFQQGVCFLDRFRATVKTRHDPRAKMIVLPIMRGLLLYVWKNRKKSSPFYRNDLKNV
jgi:hypothetical protein